MAKFCSSCGSSLTDEVKFCSSCGASTQKLSISETPAQSTVDVIKDQVDFVNAFKLGVSKTFVTDGRISRSEFWWYFLASMLIDLTLVALYFLMPAGVDAIIYMIFVVASSFFTVSGISAAVRRLHDTNRSGWWYLLIFTVIGALVLIYFLASESDSKENKYGGADTVSQPKKTNIAFLIFAVIVFILNAWSLTVNPIFNDIVSSEDSVTSDAETNISAQPTQSETDPIVQESMRYADNILSNAESSATSTINSDHDNALRIAEKYDSMVPEDDICSGYLTALVNGETTGTAQRSSCEIPSELKNYVN